MAGFDIAGSKAFSPTFGVLDFTFTATVGKVTGLTLTLTDPSLSASGYLDFFVTTSSAAYAGLKYSGVSNSYDNVDSTLFTTPSAIYGLGTAYYNQVGAPPHQQDTFAFTALDSGLASYLTGQLNSGSGIRVLVAEHEGAGAENSSLSTAVFEGASSNYAPTLNLDVVKPVPEPISMVALGAGLIGLVVRRRK
jgi:hypothetical protein